MLWQSSMEAAARNRMRQRFCFGQRPRIVFAPASTADRARRTTDWRAFLCCAIRHFSSLVVLLAVKDCGLLACGTDEALGRIQANKLPARAVAESDSAELLFKATVLATLSLSFSLASPMFDGPSTSPTDQQRAQEIRQTLPILHASLHSGDWLSVLHKYHRLDDPAQLPAARAPAISRWWVPLVKRSICDGHAEVWIEVIEALLPAV